MKDLGWSKLAEPYHHDEVMEVVQDFTEDMTESEKTIHWLSSSDASLQNGLECNEKEGMIVENDPILVNEDAWHGVTENASINPNLDLKDSMLDKLAPVSSVVLDSLYGNNSNSKEKDDVVLDYDQIPNKEDDVLLGATENINPSLRLNDCVLDASTTIATVIFDTSYENDRKDKEEEQMIIGNDQIPNKEDIGVAENAFVSQSLRLNDYVLNEATAISNRILDSLNAEDHNGKDNGHIIFEKDQIPNKEDVLIGVAENASINPSFDLNDYVLDESASISTVILETLYENDRNDKEKGHMLVDDYQVACKEDVFLDGRGKNVLINPSLRSNDCALDEATVISNGILDSLYEYDCNGKEKGHVIFANDQVRSKENVLLDGIGENALINPGDILEYENECPYDQLKSNVSMINQFVCNEYLNLNPKYEEKVESGYVDLAQKHSDMESQSADDFSFGSDLEWDKDELEIGKSQHIGNTRPFDLKILMDCVASGETVLNKVIGKDVVLVVGKTGVGKSLFIQGIAGVKIKSHVHVSTCYGTDISTNVFEAVDPLPGFAIGHDKASETKSISCFCRSNTGKHGGDIVYIDSPGWEDTAGSEVDIATSIMLSQIIKHARTLRVVMLISYVSLLEDRGGAIRGVLKLAHTFVSDFDKNKKSFVFLFTHTNEVDIPATLDEARSCLTNEILRIRRDTDDPEVNRILSFMHKALIKNYGFVDILHPLTADFSSIGNFIETSLSAIRKPASMTSCGMTLKSELKLIGQAQHMLNLVHRLFQTIKTCYNPDVIRELKEIKDVFAYLSKHVEMGDIQNASRECNVLFLKHVNQQRLQVEEQIARVGDERATFGQSNLQLLKDAISHLDVFASEDDGGISSQYNVKLLQDAAEKCFIRGRTNFSRLDKTIQDFLKIKLLSEGFPYCENSHCVAHEWLQTQIDVVCDVVSGPKDHDFECFDEESISEYARSLVMLGSIVRENKMLFNYGIVTSICVSIFESAKHEICSISDIWASSISFLNSHDCNALRETLRELSDRAAKLEAFIAVLYNHKKQSLLTNLIEKIDQSLDGVEALVRAYFQSMCAAVHDNQDSNEEDIATIASIEFDFQKHRSKRWQFTSHIYQDMISNLRNTLMMKALKLENAACSCTEHGLSSGEEDGKLFKDFVSNVWFDQYDSNQDFVRMRSDTAYDNYRCRMVFVVEQLTACSDKIKVLSEENAGNLQLYCKFAAEFKQFNTFIALAEIPQLCDEQGKILARDPIHSYIKELREQSKKLCSRWSTLFKEGNDKEELKALTENLAILLGDIEVIEAVDPVLEPLQTAAVSSQEFIVSTLKDANNLTHEAFEKPFDYKYKAAILRNISSIQGFTQIDCHLPGFAKLAENSRNLVSSHAVNVEKLVKASVDTKEIEEALNEFRKAKALDPYINDEATKRLLSLESICEKQVEICDKIIEDMIVRKDFVEIGKYLNPLCDSDDIIKRNKLNMYSRKVANVLLEQIQLCEGRLQGRFSTRDAQYFVDTLRIVVAANNEVGSTIHKRMKLVLSEKIVRLKSELNKKFVLLETEFLKGRRDYNFFTMGISHQLATILYELAEPFLNPKAKDTYDMVSKKWIRAQMSVTEKAETFLSSMFQDSFKLLKALSTLRQASNFDGMHLPMLDQLYKSCVSDLSINVNNCLLGIREQVEGTCCYNDGIPVLKAFEKASKQGMGNHLSAPPYDCRQVISMWIQEQSKMDGLSASPEISSLYLKEMKNRMDNLQNPNFVQRLQHFFLSTDKSNRQLQDQMEQRVMRDFYEGIRYLQQQDYIFLKRNLDRLTCIAEILGTHVPLASVQKQELESNIYKVFDNACMKSVQHLKKEDIINFEPVLKDLRLLVITFPFLLGSDIAIREFSLVAQLVHDILRSRIDNLYASVCNHDFLSIRNLVEFNRNHGAFLADHYGLLFEELKQRGKLRENEWFIRIWVICCEHYATGRDLCKINSFAVLGIIPSASQIDIKKANKQNTIQEHPDKKLHLPGSVGEEFRRAKDAENDLLASNRFSATSQLFDSLILDIPSQMEKSIRGRLKSQDYKSVSKLLEQLSEFERVCNLINPPLPFEHIVLCINESIKAHTHGVQLEVEKFWYERNYRELNLCIEDLKVSETCMKFFPNAFPKSWNQGIVEKIEKEIEKKRKRSSSTSQE